ncbi:MAG: LptF/LptG family permease, partial [Bacteroidota bacterium]
MKKVDKLLLKPFLALFVLSLCVTVFVLVMQIFLVYFDELVGKSVGWTIYAQLLGYMGIYISPQALSLSILVASIITFGNLSEHAELIALKSAGISLFRILMPLMIFVTILSGFIFYANSYVVPRANLNFINLLYDLRKKKPDLAIREGVFYDGIPGYSIRVAKKMPDQKTLRGILIYDHTQDRGNVAVTMAESGQITIVQAGQYLALDLFNGQNYVEGEVKTKEEASVDASKSAIPP